MAVIGQSLRSPVPDYSYNSTRVVPTEVYQYLSWPTSFGTMVQTCVATILRSFGTIVTLIDP